MQQCKESRLRNAILRGNLPKASTVQTCKWKQRLSLNPMAPMHVQNLLECTAHLLQGLNLVNLTRPGKLPYFECQSPDPVLASNKDKSWAKTRPWAVVVIIVVGLIFVAVLVLGCYLYRGTEVMQKLSNLKKRLHGLPTSGPFTVVTTDIQGWTGVPRYFNTRSGK